MGGGVGTENWVRRVYPVLRSGIGAAGIGTDVFSGGMAAGWRGSGFSLPSALDTAALRAEAMGNYNNPFDLTKDAQIALASGKLAMRRRPAHPLSAALWKERVKPHVVDLRALLLGFNRSIRPVREATSSSMESQEDDEVDGDEEEEEGSEDADGMTATGESEEEEDGPSSTSTAPKKRAGATPARMQTPVKRPDGTYQRARELLLRIGTVQTLIEDVDLASSLDVDSCSESIDADASAREFARQARESLTHFLWHKQDLQDLGCTFMMDLQDGVSVGTLLHTTGGLLNCVDALSGTFDELVELAEQQAAGSNAHVGSRARVYGAKDIAPPPTASQVMSDAAAGAGSASMKAAETAPVGMGIAGAGLSSPAGATSLLDESQASDGTGTTSGGAGTGAGVGAGAGAGGSGDSIGETEEIDDDAGVMYLGPGIAVPDGPPAQARSRADSSARGASPALSGSTLVAGRNRAGSVTNRSIMTANLNPMNDRPGSVSNVAIGGGSGGGSGSGAAGSAAGGGQGGGGGDDEGDHSSGGKGAKGKEGGAGGSSAAIAPIVEESPWFLEPDYAPGDIVMTPEGQVKGATLSALMERLTTHQQFDSAFNTTFLMTYRSFTTTREFLDRVIARYRISPPVGLTPPEHEIWVSKKQRPIQMRVFNVLKLWLEQNFYEGEDEDFLPHLKEFARTEAANAKANDAQMIYAPVMALIRILDRRDGAGEQAVRTLVHATSAPAPIIPKNAKKVKLLNMEPLEMARQLTLVESARYRQIKPAECLGKAWTGPDADIKAKGIKSMIALSNDLTGWVMESILAQTDLKTRSAYIKHFILIADRCRALNNFSTMTAIISALNSAPIHRMKRTWDAVNQRTVGNLDSLMRTMSSTKNFAYYRDLLHKLNPPCVPFLGVWLTDLTFIEDGNPDRLKTDNRLINFNKRQKTAEVIREIMIYQSTQYNLTPVPLIQQYLEVVLVPSQTQDLMFDQSEKLEPKEREDERIARLLQESGFL
ncbi:hypothetical protein A4X03_0g1235 [Tilletia caries]|nr:hypothetical protein A4X03_0g1235 [Tilletia caries]